jgi:hypothetical protein
MKRLRNESGIALAVAIFALVVIGGMVSAAFFVAVQEQRVGRNTVKLGQAFAAADGGAEAMISNWNKDTYNKMAIGGSVTITRTALANSAGWYRGSIRKITDDLFLVSSEGFSQDSTARQAVGVIVRLRPIEIRITAALKTQGNLQIGGSSFINGNDTQPAGWTGCPPLTTAKPAIQISDSSQVSTSGCLNYSCLAGSPKIKEDTTINSDSLTHFGDATWADLVSLATLNLTGGTYTGIQASLSGTACNYADTRNWGDPYNAAGACATYFPIIHVAGDANINGNQGQGILIVDGDLTVQGGFEFYGPVVVRGHIKTTGTGGHFNGGVIAADVDLEQNTVLGSAVVNYSSCAITKVLNSTAAGAQMRERGWMNVF